MSPATIEEQPPGNAGTTVPTGTAEVGRGGAPDWAGGGGGVEWYAAELAAALAETAAVVPITTLRVVRRAIPFVIDVSPEALSSHP